MTADKKLTTPVDAVPPAPKLTVLGIQHVLAFYAGAVIVPLVVAEGLGLSTADTIHLINADLFTCGIATIIQAAGIGKHVGVRLPIVQGVAFTAVSPMIAIGMAHGGGRESLPAIYGSVIIAGLATFFIAPYFAKLLKFFPPVVTGTLLTVMGTTLLSVAAGDVVSWGVADPQLLPRALAYALGTLLAIVLAQRFLKGFLSTIAVLIGLVGGTIVAWILGDADFSAVPTADVVSVTTPFYFGIPQFTAAGVISILLVMAVSAVETTGDVFAIGEIVGRRIGPDDIKRALRADGIATAIGGILNSFPYTCFAQNVGLVRLTGVKSRWVTVVAGVFMIILGLLPKVAAVVAAIPSPVLGGASIAMFANVAVVGIQTLGKVDLHDMRNSVIVSTSIGLALLVTFQPGIADAVPNWAKILVGSGVTIGSITAVLLNVLFFHIGQPKQNVTVLDGKLVTLEDINEMDQETFVATFESIFPQTWPVEQAWRSQPFKSTIELRQSFQRAVYAADDATQRELVRSYFDITDLLVDPEDAPDDVRATHEVSSLAIGRLDDQEREEIHAISEQYQRRHEMPWVVAMAHVGSSEQLMDDGWHRVNNDPDVELLTAIQQITHIADDRFDAIVNHANPLRAAWSAKFDQ